MAKSYNLANLIDRMADSDSSSGGVGEWRRLRDMSARSIIHELSANERQISMMKSVGSAKVSCVQANRRAGKTRGIGALIESRVINRDDYVVRVLTDRIAGPSQNWLDCDDKESFVKRLERFGLLEAARIIRGPAGIKSIRFVWGSAIHVVDLAHQRAVDNKHGFSADFYWADEAQNLAMLPMVINQLVAPTLADSGGQLCMSGTPGKEIGSAFHSYSNGSSDGCTVVACYSWDNPIYNKGDGPHTPETRWHIIVDQSLAPVADRYSLSKADVARLRALTEDQRIQVSRNEVQDDELRKWMDSLHPDLRRQYFGAWVAAGEEYVYEWHRAPEDFYFARVDDCPYQVDEGLPVVGDMRSRVDALPKNQNGHHYTMKQWYAVIGLDIGWSPSATSWSIPVFSPGHDVAYVLHSESHMKMPDDEMLNRTVAIINELKAAGVYVLTVVMDINGTREGTGAEWEGAMLNRFNLPGITIMRANKLHKDDQITAINLDIRRGTMRFVAGDPIDLEGRNLRFKPFDPEHPKKPVIHKFRKVTLPDGRTARFGDHCLDALRYAAREIPFLWKTEELNRDEFTDDKMAEHIRREVMSADGFSYP